VFRYPGAAHQRCGAHWSRSLEDLMPALHAVRRRKFRRQFWWFGKADHEPTLRRRAASYPGLPRFWAPRRVAKFQAAFPRVLAYLRWLAHWRHRLRTTGFAHGFFRHRHCYLSRFPSCLNPAHSEQVLGCFILACEQAHAWGDHHDSECP